ncbi:FAD-dependent oxidoreductase [Nocardia jiangxiensis]|nr:FAD-dependent oxidoreductase [Nocardia jiangxiensis]
MSGLHQDHGVKILCRQTVSGLLGRETVEAVSLADGTNLPADIVVVSIGSVPAADWLVSSGLDVTRGVECDRTCAVTGVPDVVAAGDLANWYNPLYERHMRVEHWTNAIEQGTFAARDTPRHT